VRINAPSFTNVQALEYMLEGGAMGDMVVLIGTVDPVMGEADK
jgi:NADH-quinone oxidoreductase subunit D